MIYCRYIGEQSVYPPSGKSAGNPLQAAAGVELATAAQTTAVQLAEFLIRDGGGIALLDIAQAALGHELAAPSKAAAVCLDRLAGQDCENSELDTIFLLSSR